MRGSAPADDGGLPADASKVTEPPTLATSLLGSKPRKHVP